MHRLILTTRPAPPDGMLTAVILGLAAAAIASGWDTAVDLAAAFRRRRATRLARLLADHQRDETTRHATRERDEGLAHARAERLASDADMALINATREPRPARPREPETPGLGDADREFLSRVLTVADRMPAAQRAAGLAHANDLRLALPAVTDADLTVVLLRDLAQALRCKRACEHMSLDPAQALHGITDTLTCAVAELTALDRETTP